MLSTIKYGLLVAWNAMAIRAFAEAGATLGRWDFVQTATSAADFIWSTLHRDGRLMHDDRFVGRTEGELEEFRMRQYRPGKHYYYLEVLSPEPIPHVDLAIIAADTDGLVGHRRG